MAKKYRTLAEIEGRNNKYRTLKEIEDEKNKENSLQPKQKEYDLIDDLLGYNSKNNITNAAQKAIGNPLYEDTDRTVYTTPELPKMKPEDVIKKDTEIKKNDLIRNTLGIGKKDNYNKKMNLPTIQAEDISKEQFNQYGALGGKSFLEKSMEDQLANPKSKANEAWIRTTFDELKTAQQAGNLGKILNPVSEEGKGSWLGGQTKEYQKAMKLKNAQENIRAIENLRKKGYMDALGDVNYQSRKKLAQDKIFRSKDLEALNREIAGYEEELKKYDLNKQWMPDGVKLFKMFGNDDDRMQIEIAEQNLRDYPEGSVEYMQAEEVLQEYTQRANKNAYMYLGGMMQAHQQGFQGGQHSWTKEDIYDMMNGTGAYARAVESMTPEEKEALDAQLAEVSHPVDQIREKLDQATKKRDYIQSQVDRISNEIEERNNYSKLMATAADGKTTYNDEYYKYQPNTWKKDAEAFVNYQTDDIHRIVSFINGGQEYEMWKAGTSGQITNDYSSAMTMFPEEKEKLTALYNQAMEEGREPTEAKAFFEGLQPYLNERYGMYEELRHQYTARTIPIMSSVADVMMTMTQPYEALITGYGKLTGQQWAKDPNSWAFANTRAINDIENQVSKDLGDVGGFLYKGAMSGIKNFARNITLMAAPKGVASVVSLAKFFGEDFQNTYQQKLEETQDDDYAAKYALVDASISTFFEVASVETLFGDPKNMILYMLKNTGAEMSEEYFEAEYGPIIQQVLLGRSDWDKREGEILANRGYYDSNNKWVSVTEANADEAKKQATREKNQQKWEAVGSAGISMIGPMFAGAVRNNIANQQTGKSILNSGSEALKGKASSKEIATIELKNEMTLLDAAEKMGSETESGKLAANLRAKAKNGKEISKADFGKLARTIYSETNEQIGNIAQDVLKTNILEDLQKNNVKNPEKMANIIAKQIVTHDTSMLERFALSQNQTAKAIGMTYGLNLATSANNVAKASREIMEQTQNARSIQETITEMLATKENREKAVGNVAKMMEGAEVAGFASKVLSNGKSTQVSLDNQIADIVGFETKEIEENDKKTNRIYVQLSDGRTADIADVKAISKNAAMVLKFIQNDNNRIGSNRVANIVLQHANDTEDIAGMVYDAMRVRVRTVLGMSAPKTGLNQQVTQEIREAAKADFEEAENERIKNQRELKPGKGKVTYNGVTYGTNAFTEAIKGLNRTQRNEAFAIGVIAKAAGFDVELYNDAKDTTNQGSYTANGGIRINLAGEYRDGMHRGAMATLAHEMTHQLEGNSREAYASLRQFVLNNLQQNGENVEQRLQDIMDSYASHDVQLDLNGAVAELVAKSCEQVLTDENVIRKLRESDPNLYGKIRKVVSSLVDRIRTAIGMAKETSSYYSKALGNVADELDRMWLEAYSEAQQAKGTATDTQGNEYSFMGTDPATGRSVYISDYKEGTPQSVKSNALVDLVQNIWSKKPINLTITENGKKRSISAQFDPDYDPTGARKTDLGKMAHPEMASASRRRVAMNLSQDYYQILQESDYDSSQPENKDHQDVNQWHYFIDDIYYVENGSDVAEPYRIVVNIKEKNDGDYVYAYYPQRIKSEQSKKLSVMGMSPVNTGVMSDESASASDEIVSQKKNNGKSQSSIQEDEAYMDAVKTGDMEAAQRMVDRAAKDAGYTYSAFHGSPITNIISFDRSKLGTNTGSTDIPGFFFVNRRNYAEAYLAEEKDIKPEYKERYEEAEAIYNQYHDQFSSSNGYYKVGDRYGEYVQKKHPEEFKGFYDPESKEYKDFESARAFLKNVDDDHLKLKPQYTNTNKQGKVYDVKLKMENPYIYDAKGEAWTPSFWGKIKQAGVSEGGFTYNGGEYDGIIIKNFYDFNTGEKGTEYVVFDPEQIKSADLVTYDDNGNVIPLSERFNKKSGDIRYSIQDDEEYMKAVDNGEMDAAQQYVDSVAQDKGFTEKVYHGTPTGGFTVFKDWSYFTKSKPYADRYQNASASSIRGNYETTNPQTYELYMNPGKIFDTRDPKIAKLYNEARMEYGLGELTNTESGLPDWTDGRDIIEFIEDRGLDYDTILLDEGADGGYGDAVAKRGISYVTRANRVKSADTVTYDKEGNVIPPSERFNVKENDIRFSMQEPVEVNRDGLIAVHNLTEQNLLDSIAEGGFTAPSIAVIRAKMGHSKYGEISVIFKPSAIDPEANRLNKVYGQDAWTPTRSNAEIQYELNSDVMYKARDYILDKLKDVDPLIRTYYQQWVNQNIYEEYTTKSIYDWMKEARENPGMIAAYTIDKGGKVENEYRQERVNWDIYPENEQLYKDFLETLDGLDMLDQFVEDMATKPAGVNLEKWGNVFAESSEKASKYMEAYKKAEESGHMTRMKREMLWSKLRESYEYQKDGREIKTKPVLDVWGTTYKLREKIDMNDFDSWFLDQYKKAFGKKGVRNDKDLFTPSGNRRSFDKLHWDATTENIVKAMYANHEAKGGEAGGATGLMAKASKEYKNLDEIRKDSERLQLMEEKEYEAKVKKLDEMINQFCQDAWNETGWSTDSIKEALIEAGGKYAKNQTTQAIRQSMADIGIKISERLAKEAQHLMEIAREIPTGYFEAKPERVMGFDEVEKVIVPYDISAKLKDQIDASGIPYETYDGTDEDRLRALNEQTDAQFSFQDETELDVGHWMQTVNENSLQTEAEKQLLRRYKDLRMRLDLREMQKRELQEKIRKIESVPEAQRDAEQKKQLKNLESKMNITQKVIDDTLEELAKARSEEGFARMMYQQSKLLSNFIYGRTQAEVRESVEAMEKSAKAIAQRIAENRKAIAELEKNSVVQQVKKVLGRTTVEQAAADLKKAYNSTWTKGEILNYLNPIVLKMAKGEDIDYDVQELAGILIDSNRDNVYEGLSGLRGLTITIGKGQQKELKGQNSSLKEIRRRLAGTGIQVKYGDRSTLEADIESLREEYPEMPDFGNEKDALENFVSWVEGMKRQSGAQEFYNERLAEAMSAVMKKAAGAMSGIYIPAEGRARDAVTGLIEFVKSLNAKTQQYEKELADIAQQMETMQKAGATATGMVNTLQRDVNIAIDYYNKMAKIAEDSAKQQKQSQIIEQLKSKHAQQILKNNEEWRNLIERDKQARQQAEENRTSRSKISTVVRRLYNLLKNPQGMKNIPEHMQGLAREIIGTIVENDLVGQKLSNISRTDLTEAKRVLDAWKQQSGEFTQADLMNMENFSDAYNVIMNDMLAIDEGITKYNSEIRGKNKLDTIRQRGEILKEIQTAVSEIYSFIQAEREISVGDRKIQVEDAAYDVMQGTGGKKFREWTGKIGRTLAGLHKAIVSGNMTPEYFFRTLGNEGLSTLWEGYHAAENRNGLELRKAQEKLQGIAEKYGYRNWDTKTRQKVELKSGDVNMTLGQIMSLYATWKREQQLGPEMSEHLKKGGFYVEETDPREGILGRAATDKKAHRVTEEDMKMIGEMLTEEQKQYVDDVVGFMSQDMSELGNEASMKAYGIKMYKEKYYFPFQIWDGVKSRKSNDSGSAAGAQDRAFHPSFSKSRMHGAQNALVLGDFTQTAADHIAGMINYATMGLANESLQKVLNYQTDEGYGNTGTKRNVRAIIEEAYGQEAMQYLAELQKQLNGGAVKTSKSMGDKAISLFRKNAVAGSLSVAMQQPLSYIRAAMMIKSRYLAAALNPKYWKGSYEEMLQHSGVAVIKDMGRFDMNFGQSAREYLMPEGREGKAQKAWNFITDKATVLPEMMDRMTWTRMWSAVKAEQKALHPEMDVKSDEFLDMVGERFNDLMRRTQVYDSVLVKSANMRNDNYWVKSLTSFMAEPTLTLNVLADAVRQAKNGEKGGKKALATAGATFLLSAIMQAAVKGLMGSGRNPDDKKTWEENFLYRFWNSFLSEADVLQLVPGFSDLVNLIQDGELNDDAMGAIGKIFQAGQKTVDMLIGNEDLGYRNWEDSVAQLTQIFSGLPLKNIMRDGRAIYNWFIGKPYADRETSSAILKYQFLDSASKADNMLGVINQMLGEAGWKTNNTAYYERIVTAKKTGDEQAAQDMIDYLLNGKGVKQETLESGMKTAAKNTMEAAEASQWMIDNNLMNGTSTLTNQYKKNDITREQYAAMMKEVDPKLTDNEIWWKIDQVDYQKETGVEKAPTGYSYRLKDAMEKNSAADIQKAVKDMMKHGRTQKQVLDVTSDFKQAYLEADSRGKTKIRDAIQKVYKAAGSTAAEADKKINKWK